jgi:hypothetical protein
LKALPGSDETTCKRPSLCSESTQDAFTSSVAMERMFTLVIHH